ncbi:tryptophan synthase beta subunit-like PLP-dependent enzyme [Blastocladiella britannica]|nr:tryptophan synthase beta subunit-like PLP-dependent enzyme [Blastocladiella britannica]
MLYTSTRGNSPAVPFSAAVLAGLAPDGGLYVPERMPTFPADWRARWSSLSYASLAAELFALYVDPADIPHADLAELADRAFGATRSHFRSADVAPLRELRNTTTGESVCHILELFHGPTLAFKDVALQFLGHLFEYLLARQSSDEKRDVTVVGATSGDTGSAAIAGLRGRAGIRVCILHPHGKVSPVQAAQMTSVLDANVCNVAIDGTFDDCQAAVKAMFNDPAMRDEFRLAAVNSINFARILAQISYYVYSYLRLEARYGREYVVDRVVYSVPSGNFGDVLAGYYARTMGLPIHKLIVATNTNDILHRFLATGIYSPDPAWKPASAKAAASGNSSKGIDATPTHAPAMDITVSSNFERALLLWLDNDAAALAQCMSALAAHGGFQVSPAVVDRARSGGLWSGRVSDTQIIDTIAQYAADTGYILDPHTAVGVHAADNLRDQMPGPQPLVVCLSTAHPGKFTDAVCAGLRLADATNASQSDAALLARFVPPQIRALDGKPRRLVRIGRPDKAAVAGILRKPWPIGNVQWPAATASGAGAAKL